MWKKIALGTFLFSSGIVSASAFADLSLSKTTSVGYEKNIARYDEFEVTISYKNAGPDVAKEVIVEDPYVNVYGVIWGYPEECENTGFKLHCDLGELAVGESGSITYSAQIAGGAPTGMTTHYANITAQTPDSVLFDNAAATRFRVTESFRQQYFYHSGSSFSFASSSDRSKTPLEKMGNNVRSAISPMDNEEESEKDDTEEKNSVSRITRETNENSNRSFVSYVPPTLDQSSSSVSKASNPVSRVSVPRLSSSGVSFVFLGIFSLGGALLWSRRFLFQK